MHLRAMKRSAVYQKCSGFVEVHHFCTSNPFSEIEIAKRMFVSRNLATGHFFRKKNRYVIKCKSRKKCVVEANREEVEKVSDTVFKWKEKR